MEDRRTKVLKIARTVKISYESVETIIHDHLKMSKVSAQWIPRTSRSLTAQDRHADSRHLKSSWISSRLTKRSLYDILLLGMKPGFILGTQKVNKSMQWKHASFPPPSKFKTAINWQDYGDHLFG